MSCFRRFSFSPSSSSSYREGVRIVTWFARKKTNQDTTMYMYVWLHTEMCIILPLYAWLYTDTTPKMRAPPLIKAF